MALSTTSQMAWRTGLGRPGHRAGDLQDYVYNCEYLSLKVIKCTRAFLPILQAHWVKSFCVENICKYGTHMCIWRVRLNLG